MAGGGGDLSFDSDDDGRKNICSVLVFEEDDIGSISVGFNISVCRYIVCACCCCHFIHLQRTNVVKLKGVDDDVFHAVRMQCSL